MGRQAAQGILEAGSGGERGSSSLYKPGPSDPPPRCCSPLLLGGWEGTGRDARGRAGGEGSPESVTSPAAVWTSGGLAPKRNEKSAGQDAAVKFQSRSPSCPLLSKLLHLATEPQFPHPAQSASFCECPLRPPCKANRSQCPGLFSLFFHNHRGPSPLEDFRVPGLPPLGEAILVSILRPGVQHWSRATRITPAGSFYFLRGL